MAGGFIFIYFFAISIKEEKLNNFWSKPELRDVEEGVKQTWGLVVTQCEYILSHSLINTVDRFRGSSLFPSLELNLRRLFFSLFPWVPNIILLLDSCQLFWAFVSAMWTKSCPQRRSLKEFLPSGYNYLTPLLVPELEMSCFLWAAASSFCFVRSARIPARPCIFEGVICIHLCLFYSWEAMSYLLQIYSPCTPLHIWEHHYLNVTPRGAAPRLSPAEVNYAAFALSVAERVLHQYAEASRGPPQPHCGRRWQQVPGGCEQQAASHRV